MRRLPIHGRGAAGNPSNRFQSLEVDRETWTDVEDPGPETRFLRDRSRTVITTNDSPDVPFEASLNPYRGCEHGCIYCLRGDTPVLMGDGSHRPIRELRPGDEIYGTRRSGHYRRYVRTNVRAHWSTMKPSYRVELADGTTLFASADHRFLTWRGWKHVTGACQGRHRRPHLTENDRLKGPGRAFAHGPSREVERAELAPATDLRVRNVEPTGRNERLYDITTGTGDFIADGVVSHNCYARPTHEYLGFSAGLDFESRILVKEDAPELLREELADPSWEPKTLALSGVTDPYQPIERRLQITRRCLEVLTEARNPVGIVTKSRLVLRDRDHLAELARHRAARVAVSITTLDEELRRVMEPRAPTARRRLQAVERLAEAGVPVGVLVAPVIPGLNDEEVPALLEAAAAAGAGHAGYVLLRLPHGVEELFVTWLLQHFPDRKEKVLGRIREARGGRLNDPRFGSRMSGEGAYARQIGDLFRLARRKHGLDRPSEPLSTAAFRRPAVDGAQIELFGTAAPA